MQCPSCKTKLPAAGEVLVDGRALGVYQCPTCIRLWKLGASQFATALTFAVTSNGDLLDPESLLPIDRSELRTTKGETDDDRGN